MIPEICSKYRRKAAPERLENILSDEDRGIFGHVAATTHRSAKIRISENGARRVGQQGGLSASNRPGRNLRSARIEEDEEEEEGGRVEEAMKADDGGMGVAKAGNKDIKE